MHQPIPILAARLSYFGALLLMLFSVGCSHNEPKRAEPPAPPPVPVVAVEAVSEKVRDYKEYTGRTAAAERVEVRARVSGYLLQTPRSKAMERPNNSSEQPHDVATGTTGSRVTIREGEEVTRGTLLYLVDEEPYELALAQARGSLQAALAQAERFDNDLKRAKELLDSKSVSRAAYDEALANRAEVAGRIENLRASVARAELDLKYTRVVSPIDGLLGQTRVTEGNLVSSDTLLTTVVASDPIYVYFDVDERSLLDYRKRIRSGDVESARKQKIGVQLGLAGDEDHPYSGTIDFVDNQTDPNTGNTTIRAKFDNPDNALSPGLFAKIKAPFTSTYSAVLIPTKALGMDQQGRFVFVIRDGKAERQGVQVGSEHGDRSAIREGLQPGDWVITSGLQKVRPHSPVVIEGQPGEGQEPEKSGSTTAETAEASRTEASRTK